MDTSCSDWEGVTSCPGQKEVPPLLGRTSDKTVAPLKKGPGTADLERDLGPETMGYHGPLVDKHTPVKTLPSLA